MQCASVCIYIKKMLRMSYFARVSRKCAGSNNALLYTDPYLNNLLVHTPNQVKRFRESLCKARLFSKKRFGVLLIIFKHNEVFQL